MRNDSRFYKKIIFLFFLNPGVFNYNIVEEADKIGKCNVKYLCQWKEKMINEYVNFSI